MSFVKPNELKIYGVIFLESFLLTMVQYPVHESGHFLGGWLVGARDLKMDYFSVQTDQMDKFPTYKRVIFSLGGLIATHLLILLGFFFSRRQSLLARLTGTSLSLISVQLLASSSSYYYTILIKKRKSSSKADIDELMLAKKLNIPTAAIWLVEGSLDLMLLQQAWQFIPGNKLATLVSNFVGYMLGTIFYMEVIGPAILPDIDIRNK